MRRRIIYSHSTTIMSVSASFFSRLPFTVLLLVVALQRNCCNHHLALGMSEIDRMEEYRKRCVRLVVWPSSSSSDAAAARICLPLHFVSQRLLIVLLSSFILPKNSGYKWPLESMVPDTPGWKRILNRRFEQVRSYFASVVGVIRMLFGFDQGCPLGNTRFIFSCRTCFGRSVLC